MGALILEQSRTIQQTIAVPDGLKGGSGGIEPEFQHEDSKAIWKIVREVEWIRPACMQALADAEAYRFDLIPSVSDISGSRRPDSRRWGDRTTYEALLRTKLLRHTLNVVHHASKLKMDAGGQYGALLILAILHDFGKCDKIAHLHKSAKFKDHEEISANYAEALLRRVGGFDDAFIENIKWILASHHNSPIPGSVLTEMLNAADHAARVAEKRLHVLRKRASGHKRPAPLS